MPTYIVILFLFIVIVFLKLRTTSSMRILSMSLWIIIAYSFLLITHIFSGIKYNSGSLIRIFPYFIICLTLLLFGYYLGKRIKTNTHKKVFKINLRNLALTALFGSTLLLSDIIRLNTIHFGTRIGDFQISTIGVIGNVLASIGLIVWLKSLYEYRIYNNKISFLSYLSILSYVSGGILSAGRQALILIAISSVIMLIWSNARKRELRTLDQVTKKKKYKPYGIIILFAVFISYFLFISNVRSGIFDIDNKMNMLEREFNARISDKTIKEVKQIHPFSDIYIESLFYYSHELRRLDLMFQYYDYYPTFGLSQLSYVERRIQWLIGKQNEKSWKKVEFAVEQKGNFSSHTWGTFLTNYIMDFGRFGTLLFSFFTGLIFGVLYKNLKGKETSEKIVQHCILMTGVIFSIQYSPLAELIWTFPMVFISFIKINSSDSEIFKENVKSTI